MTIWDGVQRGYIPGETLRIPGTLKMHSGTADVDPVTFEVIRYSLMNTNLEHGQTIQRLARLAGHDDHQGLPALDPYRVRATWCSSAPTCSISPTPRRMTIKWILENRAGNPGIEPGDMFVSNDPYVGTPHQPDTIVAAPVFVGAELFCWVANVMHHADVGGSVMGSFCVDATDMFTDPPAFPPFKLVSRGEVRRDLEGMFLRQSRVPTEVHMDLRAAISANRVAVERITALVDRYGADAVKAVMNGCSTPASGRWRNGCRRSLTAGGATGSTPRPRAPVTPASTPTRSPCASRASTSTSTTREPTRRRAPSTSPTPVSPVLSSPR